MFRIRPWPAPRSVAPQCSFARGAGQGRIRNIAETQAQVVEFTDKLAEIQQKNKDAKDALDIALAQLEKLKGMCIEGGETWEERNAKREREIAALKEAMKVLDEWKSPEGPPESIQGIVDANTKTVTTIMSN